jgi:hypothetical protein
MDTAIIETAERDQRELTMDELDEVSGGLFPLFVMAFAVGFDAGFITVMALKD